MDQKTYDILRQSTGIDEVVYLNHEDYEKFDRETKCKRVETILMTYEGVNRTMVTTPFTYIRVLEGPHEGKKWLLAVTKDQKGRANLNEVSDQNLVDVWNFAFKRYKTIANVRQIMNSAEYKAEKGSGRTSG